MPKISGVAMRSTAAQRPADETMSMKAHHLRILYWVKNRATSMVSSDSATVTSAI